MSDQPLRGKTCCAPTRDEPTMERASDEPVSPAADPPDHQWVSLNNVDFLMGTDSGEGFPGDGEGPQRRVQCQDFSIAPRAVSNVEFSRFVKETGYQTDAERFGFSFVFDGLLTDSDRERHTQVVADIRWWRKVPGACWSMPQGPGSGIDACMNHPVTHVSWFDAVAYCRWSRTRLPTEAQWEYAARGGLEGKRYAWGDELSPDGQQQCNIWHGTFPTHNSVDDGYFGTAPVDAFKPNGYGLYNVCGNVWEWCADWFSPNYHRVTRSPDPIYMVPTGHRSIRGGSFLCHDSYCNRYRVAARTGNSPDSSTSHCGFRVVRRNE